MPALEWGSGVTNDLTNEKGKIRPFPEGKVPLSLIRGSMEQPPAFSPGLLRWRPCSPAGRGGSSFSLPSLGQEPSASSQAGIERSRRRSVHPEFLCRALTGLGERQDWQGFAAVNWRLHHRSFGLSWRRSRNPIFIASKPPFVASTEESSVMVAIGRARQDLSSWRTFLPLHWLVGLVRLVRYIEQV